MAIDINVKITGLEPLEALIKTLFETSQVSAQGTPVQQAPVSVAPVQTAAPAPAYPATPVQSAQVAAVPVQAPVAPAPMQQTVPTAAQAYTFDQLAVAAGSLVDAGRQAEIVGLLNQFGVQALTSLPPEQYGIFATQLRAMGARI